MKRSLLPVLLLAILAAGICLAGCTTTPPSGTGIPASSSYIAQQAPGSPTLAELNGTLTTFDIYAEKARQRWNVPGMAVAIVKDGKIIFAKGYGMKTAGGPDPVTTDSVF